MWRKEWRTHVKNRIASLLQVEPTLEGLRKGVAGLTEQGGKRRGSLETKLAFNRLKNNLAAIVYIISESIFFSQRHVS